MVAKRVRTDPSALVNGSAEFTVIDEVQFAPGMFPVLKREVDLNPVPGRFLLTGSANVFMLPKATESLAGRMEVLTLDPLSQSEIGRSPHNPHAAPLSLGAGSGGRSPARIARCHGGTGGLTRAGCGGIALGRKCRTQAKPALAGSIKLHCAGAEKTAAAYADSWRAAS